MFRVGPAASPLITNDSVVYLTPWSISKVHVDLPSDDFFALLVPVDGAPAPVRRDSHLASDGRTETEFEGAIGLLATAHAIEEVLHVRVRGVSAAYDVRRCRRRFLR
jgi:hypothetical protein